MRRLKGLIQDNPKREHGFTLIEAMIGLLVFSVGILGVMTMTVSSMNNYSTSRTSTNEVGRTVANMETLKTAGYRNGSIFTGTTATPVGSDGAVVEYVDAEDAVVAQTRLITMQNTAIKGSGPGNTYQVYYTIPLVE